MPILNAVSRALRDLTTGRVLAIMFLPMLGAIVLWTVLAWIFWDTWTQALRGFVDATFPARWLSEHGASWVLASASALTVIALLLPAVLVTALVVNEMVAMPVILSVVGRGYPGLAKHAGGSVAGSIANALTGVFIFVLLWLGTLPLWLTGFGVVAVPALNSAYLNQRLFRYDALSEHASRDEYRALVSACKGRLYLLGLVLSTLYYVPLVNLIAPVVSGLAFTHFCLAELARMRRLAGHEWRPRV